MKQNPVGVAQKAVLDVLGETAESWQDANQIFAQYDIVVGAKRVGRSSVPVVTIGGGVRGGFNAYGEGETWTVDSKKLTADQAAILGGMK